MFLNTMFILSLFLQCLSRLTEFQAYDNTEAVIHQAYDNTEAVIYRFVSLRMKKKKTKVRKPTSPTLLAKRPDEELFLDGESDTTPEPVSDADEASETRSESMVSTVGTAEEKPDVSDLADIAEVSSSAFITGMNTSTFCMFINVMCCM